MPMPAATEIHRLLSACVDDAVHELFASYGHPITQLPGTEALISTGESVASSIGFSHALVSGSITVIGSGRLVRALLAHTGVDLSSLASVSDAAGELNNMLLGRTKNKCSRFGLALELGTPTTFHGIDLRMAQPAIRSQSSGWSAFSSLGDRFFVRLDALVPSTVDRTIQLEDNAAEAAFAEGEAILFDD
jgi:hypothetical protein